ncbi:MAG TPA: BTAD domain-containing putative transcriptional regulator [Nakamurella sp.]
MHAVRRAIGPAAVELDDLMVRLNSPAVVTVDVDDFQRAAADRTADLTTTLRAARLWTGRLLPEDLYADWSAEPRRRLDDVHAAVIARLGLYLLAAGQPEAALAHLEPLAASRPLDENLHRVLIRALAEGGRRWEAFDAYERLQAAVDEAYAAEPEPPTRQLYRSLLTGGPTSSPVDARHLPAPTTSFVGRRRVLAELAQNLGRTRLLTLAGVGGVGKSRLALELARHPGGWPEFRDGVSLVELAGVQEPESVAATCASGLRVSLPSGSAPVSALARELADRSLLLVIDNCEHLLDSVSALVGELLARCPDVVVVATSREPLSLQGELIYRVPSLELPSAPDRADLRALARLESVQLFVERARLVVPSFAVGANSAEPIIRICRQLDGIPLALELAAARLAHLTVAELADGLVDALTVLGRQLVPRGGAAWIGSRPSSPRSSGAMRCWPGTRWSPSGGSPCSPEDSTSPPPGRSVRWRTRRSSPPSPGWSTSPWCRRTPTARQPATGSSRLSVSSRWLG